jgi:hypothetical protein
MDEVTQLITLSMGKALVHPRDKKVPSVFCNLTRSLTISCN